MSQGSVDGPSFDQTYKSTGYALVTKSFTGWFGTRGRIEITLASGSSYTFTLEGLQVADSTPDAGTCTGTDVAGNIHGCIGPGN